RVDDATEGSLALAVNDAELQHAALQARVQVGFDDRGDVFGWKQVEIQLSVEGDGPRAGLVGGVVLQRTAPRCRGDAAERVQADRGRRVPRVHALDRGDGTPGRPPKATH